MEHKLEQLIGSIRAFMLVRTALRYGALAAMVVVASSLVAALVAPELPRVHCLSLLAVGLIAGLVRELIRLPSSNDIAFYIDRKLEAESSIVTTIELDEDDRQRLSDTVELATSKLSTARRRDVWPRFTSRILWLYPIAIPCFALVLLLPSIAPIHSTVPGIEEVQVDNPEALSQLERLAEEAVADAERQEQLEELAQQASTLRQLLADSVEQREALDKVADLSEAVEREIGRETADQRRARDGAIKALSTETTMAKALAERDLPALDRAIERAAARRETADRARAQKALAAAADAAAGEGDQALSQLLASSERRLKRRSEQARLARELADAMPELEGGLSRALESLERDGDGSQLDEALVDAMAQAWSQLTPEERQRLADAVRSASIDPGDGHAQTDAGRPLTAEEIESRLRDALANLDDLRIQLGSGQCAMPMPSAGSGQSSGRSTGSSRGGQPGNGASGSGGHQEAPGQTQPLEGPNDLVVRVRPMQGQGAPSFSTVEWVDPRGSIDQEQGSALPAPGAPIEGSPGAIERASVPEDYEDHLRRYFGNSPRSQ